MKSIKKYLFIMMALAAVFGFVACSDEDDDDRESVVYMTKDGLSTITIYDDYSFVAKIASEGVSSGTWSVGTSSYSITLTIKEVNGKSLANPKTDYAVLSDGTNILTYDTKVFFLQ